MVSRGLAPQRHIAEMTIRNAGRNTPCPCGSGRKYKRCCWSKDVAAAASRGPYTPADRDRALARVMRFAARDEFAADEQLASSVFWIGPPPGVGDDAYDEMVTSEFGHAAYFPWFVFDFELESGRTPLDTFLDREGEGLSAGERAFLDRMRTSQMRLYEVIGIRLDEGLDLRDLDTGSTVAVRERSATHHLSRWDVVAARIIEGKSGLPEIDGLPCFFPPSVKSELSRLLRLGRREQAKGPLAGNDQAFFRRFFLLVVQVWLTRVMFPPSPTLTTSDGDSLAFTKSVFDVSDSVQLAKTFVLRDDLHRDDDGRFVWLEGTGDERRILGTFHLEGSRLTYEGMSEARAARARAFVEALGAGVVTHRLTRVQDAGQLLASARAAADGDESAPQGTLARKRPRPRGRSAAGSDLPPEVEAQMLLAYYDRHYHDWLDVPLPALDGRTPRHAARLKTQRPRVVELLKTLENHAERDRREGRPTYDMTWIWHALGIEPE